MEAESMPVVNSTTTFTLLVAAVKLTVMLKAGVTLSAHDPNYTDFLGADGFLGNDDGLFVKEDNLQGDSGELSAKIPQSGINSFLRNGITVDIQIGYPPELDIDRCLAVYKGTNSWSFYENKTRMYLLMAPHENQPPFWIAAVDRDFNQATIYCGEILVRKAHGALRIQNPLVYPLDQILLMHHLATREGAILHAAGVIMAGKGCVFPGVSGAGKSTLIRQFLASGDPLLSDDRVIVRNRGGIFDVFGTPWPGEAGIAANQSAPLAGLFFLKKSSETRVEPMTSQDAIKQLLPVVSIPWYDSRWFSPLLSFCERMLNDTPAYAFHFTPNVSAVDVFRKFISRF